MFTVTLSLTKEKQVKVTVRTEVWGNTVKAVVRNEKGQFLGATNQTEAVKVAKVIRPRVTLVGAK